MSIQAECREAVNSLAAAGGTFTEFDVANEASGQGRKGWTSKLFEQAVKNAYNVLQGDYKRGKLVRYGPVEFQGNKDYVRRGTKIIYAHPENGPEQFETPNGSFARMHSEGDPLAKAGRKAGTNRDDTKPWGGQTVSTTKQKGPAIDHEPLLKRIRELEKERDVLAAKLENGNGNGHTTPVPVEEPQMDQLVALLIDKLTEPVSENVKNSLAEALIS